jgi:hypothetical protein
MFGLSHTHSVSIFEGTSFTVRHLALVYHQMKHTNHKVNDFERLHKSMHIYFNIRQQCYCTSCQNIVKSYSQWAKRYKLRE